MEDTLLAAFGVDPRKAIEHEAQRYEPLRKCPRPLAPLRVLVGAL